MLAKDEGVRLVSAKGPFEMESHADELSVTALKDITVQSTQGHVQITAKNGITLASGGAYININQDGQIEIHSPSQISFRGKHDFQGPQGKTFPLPDLPQIVCEECLKKAQSNVIGFVAR